MAANQVPYYSTNEFLINPAVKEYSNGAKGLFQKNYYGKYLKTPLSYVHSVNDFDLKNDHVNDMKSPKNTDIQKSLNAMPEEYVKGKIISEKKSAADILRYLRNNWEPPSQYLEKRGYINIYNNDDINSELKKNHDEQSSVDDNEFIKVIEDDEKSSSKHKFKNNIYKNMQKRKVASNDELDVTMESVEEKDFPVAEYEMNTMIDEITTTTESTTNNDGIGLFKKVKTKISGLFQRKNNTSPSFMENINDYDELVPLDMISENEYKSKLLNTNPDDNIYFDDKDAYEYNYDTDNSENNDLNKFSNQQPNRERKYRGIFGLSSKPSSTTSSPTTSNYSNICKDLDKSEAEFLKLLLKCYRENKKLFTINHLNASNTDSSSKITTTTTMKPLLKNVIPIRKYPVIKSTTLKPTYSNILNKYKYPNDKKPSDIKINLAVNGTNNDTTFDAKGKLSIIFHFI